MSRAGIAVLTIGMAALLAASSCSSTDTRGPSPPPPTSSSEQAFPPRPRTIDIASADPCEMLTPTQRRGIDTATYQRSDLSPDDPGCLFSSTGNDSYVVQYLRRTGARALLPGNPQQQGLDTYRDSTRTDIAGFGAVQARMQRGSPADCVLTVDVGPDSSIQFSYSTLNSGADSPADLKAGCGKARHFASMGLANLSGR